MREVNEEAARLAGERIGFSFGKNWQRFLRQLTPEKVNWAEESLRQSFAGAPLAGTTFLDVGCGSGLFSLAARRLGADVTSVDVDPFSVECAQRLRADDPGWDVVQASILSNPDLPPADRVYSWGVLHHTGAMWEAVARTLRYVRPGGLACIALYKAPRGAGAHLLMKRVFNRSPSPLRFLLKVAYAGWLLLGVARRGGNPVAHVVDYGKNSRGMSFWRDVEDWLGGLPIEYADQQSFEQHLPTGYELTQVLEQGPGACTEYLVRRAS